MAFHMYSLCFHGFLRGSPISSLKNMAVDGFVTLNCSLRCECMRIPISYSHPVFLGISLDPPDQAEVEDEYILFS